MQSFHFKMVCQFSLPYKIDSFSVNKLQILKREREKERKKTT